MEDKSKTGKLAGRDEMPQANEKMGRRDALKRIAKGLALVGTLGITAVVTQGQDECTPPGVYSNLYYNYSNAYYNYSDAYYNYSNAYYNYSNAYYNYSNAYYNYYNSGGYSNW